MAGMRGKNWKYRRYTAAVHLWTGTDDKLREIMTRYKISRTALIDTILDIALETKGIEAIVIGAVKRMPHIEHKEQNIERRMKAPVKRDAEFFFPEVFDGRAFPMPKRGRDDNE